MDPRIKAIEQSHIKSDRPSFRAGDTLRVFVRIAEDEKTRIQPFEGVVIAKRGGSSRETFTLRRISYGEGVERTFFLHSPMIEKILLVKSGAVRRAKLFYLRKKIGKATRIEEHFEQSPTAAQTPPVRSEA